jgi:hypothetical protein
LEKAEAKHSKRLIAGAAHELDMTMEQAQHLVGYIIDNRPTSVQDAHWDDAVDTIAEALGTDTKKARFRKAIADHRISDDKARAWIVNATAEYEAAVNGTLASVGTHTFDPTLSKKEPMRSKRPSQVKPVAKEEPVVMDELYINENGDELILVHDRYAAREMSMREFEGRFFAWRDDIWEKADRYIDDELPYTKPPLNTVSARLKNELIGLALDRAERAITGRGIADIDDIADYINSDIDGNGRHTDLSGETSLRWHLRDTLDEGDEAIDALNELERLEKDEGLRHPHLADRYAMVRMTIIKSLQKNNPFKGVRPNDTQEYSGETEEDLPW